MTVAPGSSQESLRTITQWRYCHGCTRSAPMRKLAGDTVWQCLWCGKHEDEATGPPDPVQASARAAGDGSAK